MFRDNVYKLLTHFLHRLFRAMLEGMKLFITSALDSNYFVNEKP